MTDVEQLTWGLLDETIDDAGFRRLEELLNTDAAARRRYYDSLLLHADLCE